MELNNKEKKLVAEMLRLASNAFSDFGCNDVDEKVWEKWTVAERQEFVKEYHEYNGNIEEYDSNHLHLPDWLIMEFLAHKLENEII